MTRGTRYPPALEIPAWGFFTIIELCFLISFYTVFGHLPWNSGDLGLMIFGLLTAINAVATYAAWNTPTGETRDPERLHPDNQFDDWEIDIDWEMPEIENEDK